MWTLLFLPTAIAGAGFDHTHATFDQVLSGAVKGVEVDYTDLGTRRELLDTYVRSLAEAPVATFSRDEALAFWINAYNALTLDLILDEGTPASIMDLDGGKVWDTRSFRVGGADLTLNQVEHERVRKLGDGRIHAAVNCASRGCPPLPPEPIRALTVDAQLTEAAGRWARTNAYSTPTGCVQLSKVFEWYASDFGSGDAKQNAVRFLVRYAPATRQAQLEGPVCEWQPYDWALNSTR